MNSKNLPLKYEMKEAHADLAIKPNITPLKFSKQYLRVRAFMTSKQRQAGLFQSGKQEELPEPNVFHKYFGKKVTYIKSIPKLLTSPTCYKYFKSVVFTEHVGRTYKLYKLSDNSLAGLVILHHPIMLRKDSFMRMIPRLKPSTRLESCCSFQSWALMPGKMKSQFKHQSLMFEEMLPSLGNRNKQPRESFIPVALVTKKTLRTLHLDLVDNSSLGKIRRLGFRENQGFSKYEEEIFNILLKIDQLGLSQWYIRVPFSPKFLQKVERFQSIFEKIDFLGFHYDQQEGRIEEIDCPYDIKGYKYSTPNLNQLKHLTQNRKKVLDFYVKSLEGEQKIDMFEILSYCKSLKGLYIKFLADDPFITEKNKRYYKKESYNYGYNNDNDSNDDDADDHSDRKDKDTGAKTSQLNKKVEPDRSNSWASNLSDVVLSLDYTKRSWCDPHVFYHEIFTIIKEKSSNLKTLEIFLCESRTVRHQYYHDDKRYTELKAKLEGLEKITSLEELKLTISVRQYQDKPKLSFKLPNLKKLWLNFGDSRDSNWDDGIQIDSLQKLKELRITIYPDFEGPKWGRQFVKNIPYLQNLEILEIINKGNLCQQAISFKTFCSLIKRLRLFKNLRSLTILAEIKSPLLIQEGEMPEEVEEYMHLGQEDTLGKMKTLVQDYVESNKALEYLSVGKFQGFSIEKIKY